jgi:hypothetical protein
MLEPAGGGGTRLDLVSLGIETTNDEGDGVYLESLSQPMKQHAQEYLCSSPELCTSSEAPRRPSETDFSHEICKFRCGDLKRNPRQKSYIRSLSLVDQYLFNSFLKKCRRIQESMARGPWKIGVAVQSCHPQIQA